MELRNAVSKETLRKYLLTSSAEAIPQARPSLLSCFTNAENPKPQLQDRLSAAGEALESCSETALQSWFDPLEILLDQEAGTLAVRFPHAFFGIRFSSLFQKLFEKKARELWGKGLSITYGAGKFTPSPPVPFVQPAPESRQDALHPAVRLRSTTSAKPRAYWCSAALTGPARPICSGPLATNSSARSGAISTTLP